MSRCSDSYVAVVLATAECREAYCSPDVTVQTFLNTFQGRAAPRHLQQVYQLIRKVRKACILGEHSQQLPSQAVSMLLYCGVGKPTARSHLTCQCLVLLQQREAIAEVAAVEMAAACDEVGLQQQLEELEALILQRGLLGGDEG